MDNSPYGYGLPPNFSTHGASIDALIWVIHIFMIALFVGWGFFYLSWLIKYRQRPGHKAQYEPIKGGISKLIEVVVVVIEVILLVGLSMPLWAKVKNQFPAESESTVIRVVAQQFQWNAHYPGPDGIFGVTSPDLIDEELNPLGLDESDPNAADDITEMGHLHLPVEKPVIIELSSKDVIHSFFIPVARVKQDVVPGMVIPIWFEITEDALGENGEEGLYEIACSQLCGLSHSIMRAVVHFMTQEDFDQWLEDAAAERDEIIEFDDEEFEDEEDEDA